MKPSGQCTPPQRDVLINALLVLSNDQVLYENLPSEVRDVCRQAAEALMETSSATASSTPIILFCPGCGEQHIDRPEPEKGWTNPPHATHTCAKCGLLWRPSNHNTEGIAFLKAAEPKHIERIAAALSPQSATEPRLSSWVDLLAKEGVRSEVLRFAVLMERKLSENDHKSHWSGCGPSYLLKRLRDEVVELERILLAKSAPTPAEVAGEAADVANFAMMLADNAGALPTGQPADRGNDG